MKNILIVIGSARQGRAADNVAKIVTDEVKELGAEAVIADLKAINLPFFDSPLNPASDEYELPDGAPSTWSKMVTEADAVVFLTPEYNHGTSAIIKNSIDWLYKEWQDKPISLIGYGWGGAPFAITHLTEHLSHIKANVLPSTGSLFLTRNIGFDGSPIDDSARETVNATLKELLAILQGAPLTVS